MFETNAPRHDRQDRLREELRKSRRRMTLVNIIMIATSACAVALYWSLF